MAKLNRLTAKIFGETASTTNTPKEIGQFGSAKAGTYNATGDVAVIQSLPAWSNGWIGAVTPTDQFPPLPEMTGVHKVLSYQNAYLLQQGIPEWDSATTYYENGFCAYNGIVYKSIIDENVNNQPDNSPGAWFEYGSGNYANQDINNLTDFGNARLQYAPFSINAGTVINGNNHTLQSGSFIQSYTTSGVYTIEITEAGNYEIEMYGAGGGWASNRYATDTWYARTFTGGSGAGYKGVVNLSVGTYTITVGKAATGRNYETGSGSTSAGGSTSLDNLIVAGGGGGATAGPSANGAVGLGGAVVINDSSIIVNTELSTLGNNGNYASLYPYTGVPPCLGAASVYDGTTTGYGAGAGSSNVGQDGYFKITKLTGDASKIFCDPCTITTCDGRTKVYANSASYDVSDQADGDYSVFKDYETGNLSLVKDFGISKALAINVNIIGSLTNNNGILSGFGTSNYAEIPQQLPLANANSFEFVFKFNYNTSTAIQSIFTERNVSYFSQISILTSGELYCQLSNNHSSDNMGSGTGSTTLTNGNTYYVKLSFDGSAYKVYLSSTGEFSGEETEEISITNSAKLLNFNWNIGCSALSGYEQPFNTGSIDLKESYININGQRWWSGTKPWLDTSTTPANLKTNGEINNDLVYIGDCLIENSVVTVLKNKYFNACPYHRDLVESYQNGTSWYVVYSDGWCEQGGFIQANINWQTCTLLKPFVNTNYNIYVSGSGTTAGQGNSPCYVNNSNKTINSFQYTSAGVVNNIFWQACGYIN